ncbi:Metallo-dependent hydrolase [Nadsonia fulvescens var. elongata DSM 6958]|uniref:Metallo-dependent hydrolase n=1 Tax=Nadsonia fulvescens var. elongata DSM 6958 TaxID=857566 RepID=A0A1E3PSW5_9ASCO|nr:Metallo-dependent hydrolase [Nadsonia fulvescens var. elongata DSM 6958]
MTSLDEIRTILTQHPQIKIIDAHCHLNHESVNENETGKPVESLASILAVMSTQIDEFSKVSKLMITSPGIIGAFGLHPWFSHHVYDDSSLQTKLQHYQAVLVPSSKSFSKVVDWPRIIADLPEPMPLTKFKSILKEILLRHPKALIGECGLDKSYRVIPRNAQGPITFNISMEHQKLILCAQLEIALGLDRALSIHGVNCHGALYELLMRMSADGRNPLKVCLHSYSGPPSFLANYFPKRSNSGTNSHNIKAYLSLSYQINYTDDPRRWATFSELLNAVPANRILIESDYHGITLSENEDKVLSDEKQNQFMENIIKKISEGKEWELGAALSRFYDNWMGFTGETDQKCS